MTRHTETTTTFSCDLCGTVFTDRKTLTELYGPPYGLDYSNPYHSQADICTPCLDRPIAELVNYFRERRG